MEVSATHILPLLRVFLANLSVIEFDSCIFKPKEGFLSNMTKDARAEAVEEANGLFD